MIQACHIGTPPVGGGPGKETLILGDPKTRSIV